MATETRKRAKPRTPLSSERILEEAIRLADENGIESLTMRNLAKALGVEAMSLYNHVANKGALVDGMVDVVMGEFELPTGGDDWQTAVRRCAISAHEALIRHPWACSLAIAPTSTRSAPEPRVRYMEWLLGTLREGGFSADLAYHAYHAVDAHIMGFTLWQLGHSAAAAAAVDAASMADFAATFGRQMRERGFGYLAEHIDQHLAAPPGEGAREFEFSLDLILDGLERARRRG
jgi:AcrR family transcriptional regulator